MHLACTPFVAIPDRCIGQVQLYAKPPNAEGVHQLYVLNAVGLTCRSFTMHVDIQWHGVANRGQGCVNKGGGSALLRPSGRAWVLQCIPYQRVIDRTH